MAIDFTILFFDYVDKKKKNHVYALWLLKNITTLYGGTDFLALEKIPS